MCSVIALLVVVEMDAALELVGAGPAAGALVLALEDRPSALHAADRRIARVVQRVVRYLVDGDIGLDSFRIPVDDRMDLPDPELVRALDLPRVLPGQALLAPDAADPRVVRLQSLLERLDLADVAAAIGVPLPEVRGLPDMLLGDREDLRLDQLAPLARHQPVARLVRLAEEEVRVELDHGDVETQLGGHVHEHGGLLLPRAGEAELVAELLVRPAEDVLRRHRLEVSGQLQARRQEAPP